MSRVEKLAIQGIRSFGPDESRRIEFYTPLTLILGQNGCGKTTIIESLKYITTGEVPPGCGKGGAFVHDPKVAKETAVRGQVKLLFRNTRGQKITSTRSLEVTQKAKKLECKTLDATIQYEKPDGSKSSISSKCADFQVEMTSLLGVAKPILENVIFCHQEDANWPLDEGKKVKDKFDSIFNATKYIKCLETIRKIRKDQKQRVNNMSETLEALKSSKEHAARLRKELSDVIQNLSTINENQEKMIEEQEPLRKRIKEISKLEENYSSISADLQGKEYKLSSIRDMQKELKSSQQESYTCSDIELSKLILDFERDSFGKKTKKKELEHGVKKLDDVIAALKKEESKALMLIGQLAAVETRHFDSIKKRNALLNNIIENNLIGQRIKAEYSVEEAEDVISQFSKYIENEKSSIDKKVEVFETKESELQGEINKLRSDESILDHDITTLTKQIDELMKKIRMAVQNLSNTEETLSSTNLDKLKLLLDSVNQKIEQEEKRVNTTAITEEVEASKRKIEEKEKELGDVMRRVAKLNKQAGATAKRDQFLKDKASLEQRNQFLKRKNADDFQTLFNGTVGDNLRNDLEAYLLNIKRQIADTRESENSLKQEKTELETNLLNNKSLKSKKENEFKEFQEKMENICRGTDLENAIASCKKTQNELTHRKSSYKNYSIIHEEFKQKLERGEPCPLCHREFVQADRSNVEDITREIEKKLLNMPENIEQATKQLKSQTLLLENLLQLVPQKEAADKANAEAESLRMVVKELYSKLENINNELEGCSGKLGYLLSEEETALRIQPDVVTIDSNIKKIKELTDQISLLQEDVGSLEGNLTMDDLLKHQSELEGEIKSTRGKIDSSQEKILSHVKQMQMLKDRRTNLSGKELELKTKQLEAQKLREEISRYKEEKTKLEEQIAESKQKIAPFKYKIKDSEQSKSKLKLEKDSYIKGKNKEVEVTRKNEQMVKECQDAIKYYINNNSEGILNDNKQKLEQLHEECLSKEEEKKKTLTKVNEVQIELTNQNERKRNLDDEKRIRDKEVEAFDLQKQIQVLKTTIKDFNYENMYEEKQSLLIKHDKLCKSRATLEGRIEELKIKKRDLESNLNNKGIKDAEKNYKEKLIQQKCINIACEDLNKYYKALDTAIMKFHVEKMSRINSIIRELWRTTYKGNDIDYIEIKTDETESQGADKRRTYNYRVVMVKNDVDMDMRARCSAGQKVLASLIIRMALAETFSSNCGILALDEPTTNLDRVNIESLSLALINIVNRRSHQRNFQLIVITHDDEFLEGLTRADNIEYYHKVSRNERGLSVITRCAVHRV